MKSYIITGSSSGLGKAIVEALLTKNDTQFVLGIARHQTIKHDLYQHLHLDLKNISRDIDLIINHFPIIHQNTSQVVLINNAAILGEIQTVGHLKNQNMADLITINLTAPMILTNSFLSHYQSSINSKMIINISSGASRKEYDGWAGYSTSKAGLERFSLIVQKEQALQNQNVKVYAVSPSVIDTKMQTEIRHANIQNFSQLEKFINLKNQNELEKPEDIAKKIIYLMENPHRFQEVVQDVRNFEINEN